MIEKIEPTALVLPEKHYGPICGKILKEFISYHNLPNDLPVPEMGLFLHVSLARIFNIMIMSMGEEKRNEVLKEAEEYLHSLNSDADIEFTQKNMKLISQQQLDRIDKLQESQAELVVPCE